MLKKNLNSSLTTRTLVVALGSILTNAIAMLTAPVFTRLLSTSDYGVFSVFMSWVNILAIVLSLQTRGTINNGKIEFEEKDYEQYCADIYNLSFVVFVAASIIFLLFDDKIAGMLKLPVGCVFLLIVNACGSYMLAFITGYLTIEEKVTDSLKISVVYTVLSTVLSIVFISSGFCTGYNGRIWGYTIPHILLIVYTFIYFNRFTKIGYRKNNVKYCLMLSLPLIMHGLSGIVLGQSDRIMLLSMQSESIAGIYSFCYTIALPVSVVYGALNSTWVPNYYLYMAEKKYDKIEKHHNRYMFLVVGITCGYILIAPEMVKLLSVKEYWSGINIMPLVIAAYFFNFLYLFPANYEFFLKNTKYIAISSTISAIVNIVLNYLLIPKIGMYGAAIATIISYIINFETHDYVARHVLGNYTITRKFYFAGAVPVIVCVIGFYFISDIWLLRWILAAGIGAILLLKMIRQKALF